MMIVVQSLGLVMALLIVKIRHMAGTLPAMIMMVVTVKAVARQVVAVKTVMIVNLIGPHMDLNAVIQPGTNMELTELHSKVHMAGIAPVVIARVMAIQFVVMVHVMVMKLMIHAQKIVMLLVSVMLVT